jgi:hypothetical protein
MSNFAVSECDNRPKLLTHKLGKAIANFFTPASKKEPEKMSWRTVNDSLLIGRYRAPTTPAHQKSRSALKRQRIAAFDFVSHCPIRKNCLSLHFGRERKALKMLMLMSILLI